MSSPGAPNPVDIAVQIATIRERVRWARLKFYLNGEIERSRNIFTDEAQEKTWFIVNVLAYMGELEKQ
jgi:hypothetical protein